MCSAVGDSGPQRLADVCKASLSLGREVSIVSNVNRKEEFDAFGGFNHANEHCQSPAA